MPFVWSSFKNNPWGVPPIRNPVTGQGQTAGARGGPPPPEWQTLTAHANAVAAQVRKQGRWSASLGFELALHKGKVPAVKTVDAPHAPGGATPGSPNASALVDAHRQVPSTRFELWVNGPSGADPDHPRGSRWTFVGALPLREIQAIRPDHLAKIAVAASRRKAG